jgi:hypothetical protein
MKKLSFIFAMVFAASFAMAQNTATVTELGNNNAGYVNQLGATNTATIDQIGNLNNASTSDVYASSLFGKLTDTKGVTQVGDHNTGTITQHNPYVGTTMAGPIAGLNQTGDWNTAIISQTHNTAWDQEYAWAKQSGDGNMSTQNQDYTYAFQSHIWQQGRSLANPGDALTTVGNIARTDQEGGYGQNASIWQDGVRNNAYSFQGNAAFGYTQSNLAETTQKGNDNKSTQYQYGSSNTAKTIQLTNSNTSNLIQNGNQNEMVITQKIGNLNVVNLTQSDEADGYVNQFGDNNVLKGLDADIIATSLNGSTLHLDQTGSGNTLSLQQTNGATAIVTQNGITNTSVVIQN